MVRITYLKGFWRTQWVTWMQSDGQPWVDTLPKSCIILINFQLIENNKLHNDTYKFLKNIYQDQNK